MQQYIGQVASINKLDFFEALFKVVVDNDNAVA
jgi:hypothetical protein